MKKMRNCKNKAYVLIWCSTNGGNRYVVEAIQDHRSDFEDVRKQCRYGLCQFVLMFAYIQGQMRYLVKWKGYEKKADRTWELEDSFE